MNQVTICFLLRNNPEGEVLLGFKKIGFGAGKYAGVGGKVEPDETTEIAAMREVEEEIGVKILAEDIRFKGTVTFLFPSKPEWSQRVSIFTAERWSGEPRESDEMVPAWFKFSEIPYHSMWQDACHWIPQILAGTKIQTKIVFQDDNETVNEVSENPEFAPTCAIIQARMGSSRLPGKVLLDIADQPMLKRVVERTRLAKTIDQVVIATTSEPSDDPIVELCAKLGYACSRGSLYDVLDRYYQAARQFKASNIVRITADCPLIDPEVIDRTVNAFYGQTTEQDVLLSDANRDSSDPNHKSKVLNPKCFDFVANRLPPPWGRSYPIGLDTEVCTFEALEAAWNEATAKHQREHVMPFFYENLERFRVLLVNHPENFGTLRWTVDTAEDLEALRQIYARFPGRDDISWLEVLALYQREPELGQINARVQHKHYQQVDERQK